MIQVEMHLVTVYLESAKGPVSAKPVLLVSPSLKSSEKCYRKALWIHSMINLCCVLTNKATTL